MAPSVFWDQPNSNLPGSDPGATPDSLQRIALQDHCDFLGSIGPHSGELISCAFEESNAANRTGAPSLGNANDHHGDDSTGDATRVGLE